MPTNVTDPVTGIVIPTPGEEPGEQYAVDVSNALLTLAHLTHTGASNQDGYQIPSAGINFNADLSAQSNNLTDLRSTRYTVQSSPLAGPGDRACVYFSGVDLYCNDANGVPIKITGGGALDVTVSNNYVPKSISANYTIQTTDGYEIFIINTSAARVITLPLAANVAAGRFYIFKDATGTAFTHHVTINCSGADKIDGAASYTLEGAYSAICLVGDGSANWELLKYDQVIYKSGESLTFDTGSTLTTLTGSTLAINSGTTVTAALNSASSVTTSSTPITLGGASVVTLGGTSQLNTANSGTININTNSGFICSTVGGMQLTNVAALSTQALHAIQIVHAGGLYTNSGPGSIELGGTSADIGFTNTQSILRNVAPRVIGGLQSNWQTYFAGPYGALTVPTTTSNQQVILEIPYLLDGQTLNSVHVYWLPVSHSSLPQHFPSLDVRATNTTSTTVPGADFSLNTGAPISPTAANVSAYNALKGWTFTCNQVNVIDHTNYMYYMILTDEYGTNSLAGGTYYGFQLNYSVTDMRIA